jgi:hypothetical protein
VQRPALTTAQRRTASGIAAGALTIAGIGFAGSYTAVRGLALHKGFGWFATILPAGIDAGIVVLLALDLLLTWLRIPFPLLRQTAWLLTAATIAFNGAAAWPDPLGVAMHAVIPALFIIVAEAGRHAVGRVADITADRHMEPVRLARWLLAPFATFRLWRRMKLWELRSYDEVIRTERDRLTYRAQLRARYGPMWRRRAPVEAVLRLRLTRYGAALPSAAAPAAPRRHTVICGAALGPLTVPPQPVAEPQHHTPPPAPAGEAPVKPADQPRVAPPQHPAATPDPFDRHTDEALRLAGMSKAAAVRAVHQKHPDAGAPQIVAYLATHGISASLSAVRTELSRERKRSTATPGTGYYP